MDIKAALVYPYRKGHFWYSVGIPTVIYFVAMAWLFAWIFVPTIVGAVAGWLPKGDCSPMPGWLIACMVLSCVSIIPLCFWLYGYYWAMVANWQTNGLDASPPPWKGQWKAYFVDGFHCFVAILVMYIPMVLGVLTLGFLMPFVMAPFMESAQDRRLGAFFRKLPQSLMRAYGQYWSTFKVMWMCILLYIPFYLVLVLTSMTLVGPMLVAMAMCVSYYYLFAQAYWGLQLPSSPLPSGEVAHQLGDSL